MNRGNRVIEGVKVNEGIEGAGVRERNKGDTGEKG